MNGNWCLWPKRKQSYKRKWEKEPPFIGGVTRRIRSSKSLVECNPPYNRALTIFFCRVLQLLSSPYSLRIRPTSESGQEFNMSSALRLACHRPVHQFNWKEKLCTTLSIWATRYHYIRNLFALINKNNNKSILVCGKRRNWYISLTRKIEESHQRSFQHCLDRCTSQAIYLWRYFRNKCDSFMHFRGENVDLQLLIRKTTEWTLTTPWVGIYICILLQCHWLEINGYKLHTFPLTCIPV